MLIDAHTKRNCRNYHRNTIVHPTLLNQLPPPSIYLGVIEIAGDAIVSLQVLAQLFAILNGLAVNYPALVPKSCSEKLADVTSVTLQCSLGSDFIV